MKENKYLEFKSEISNTFLKTVSAFANFGDGKIIFGRADDGTVVGIEDAESKTIDIENRINDTIQPKPDFTLQVDAKTKCIILSVFEGEFTPYLYKGKAYRRSDTASLEVDQLELRRLTLQGMHLDFEQLESKEQDLSFHRLEKNMVSTLAIDNLTNDIFKTIGFKTKDNTYNIAAALFADKNKFYGIDIVRFGDSINEIVYRNTVTNCSILEQFDAGMAFFDQYYKIEQIQDGMRREKYYIPKNAFREALANALVHRTWDINAHIKVAAYKDRIEITSPGGLPRGIGEKEYKEGKISFLRNPIIGNLMFRMRYIEMFATGVKRILNEYHGCPMQPGFEVLDNTITVVLPCIDQVEPLTIEENLILSIFDSGLILSTMEVAERTSFSKAKVLRILHALQDKGRIQSVGNGRGIKYVKV